MEQEKRKPGRPKNSDTKEQARNEVDGRPDRIPMGMGANLSVSPAILAEIEARGCVPRWCLDDEKGKMEQYMAAYWVPYKDANGKQITRPSGSGRQHVLMMLERKYYEEDKALKRKKNNAILAKEAALKSGDGFLEYIPDDRQHVVSSDL